MVLDGLSSAIYVGWASGIILIKSPKSPLIVFEKRSLYTFFVLISYILMSFVWIDFHIRHIRVLDSKKESSVDQFLSLSLFIGATLFDLYFRLCFFTRAKIVARFLKSLENDMDKIPFTRLLPKDRKTWRNYKKLIKFVQIYHCTGAIFTSLWVASVVPKETLFLGFIPYSVYPVIFFLFGAVPLVSSFFVSFAFVVTSTMHIQWIFDDFSRYFEDQILIHEEKVLNPMRRDLGEVFSIPSKSGTNDQILSKFEHLKLLCSQYDKICGPLLLGLIVRAVFILISSANTILLYNGNQTTNDKRMKLFLNIYHFLTEITQLVLLQLGYVTQRRFSEKKENLHRKVILMTNLGARDQMKEAIGVMSHWEWEMSGGPGFFEVNRPLLSGVVSSLMTYVTILFQLNVVADSSIVDNKKDMELTTISSINNSSFSY